MAKDMALRSAECSDVPSIITSLIKKIKWKSLVKASTTFHPINMSICRTDSLATFLYNWPINDMQNSN